MHLSPADFDRLRRAIHRLCGLVVPDDKQYLVRDRLTGVVQRRGLPSFDALRERLEQGGDASLADAVIDAVTTQETSFFRDPHVWEALASEVIPRLAATGGLPIRIWSAAVSTGQEVYSLAILVHEFAQARPGAERRQAAISILGSDVSAAALATAEAGVYDSRDLARGLGAARARTYFEPHESQFRVATAIRRLVEFRRVNLAEPFGFLGRFDLICCRNLLIYFDESTRRKVCRQFHALLAPGGRLLLGAAENLYGISADFESIQLGQAMIYRKS